MDRGSELHLRQPWFAGDDGLRRSHLSIWNSGRPRLLAGRHSGHLLSLAGDAALLLHLQDPFGAGLSPAALWGGRALGLGGIFRGDDDSDERHQHVFHGHHYESDSGMEYPFQYLGLFVNGGAFM